ncbi:uncharacterized protein LOC131855636 isoform X1 [Achroia grisella]|uniref:uncharacterized protein LOC131855636 isoform X1 n=1 Tax=Achroia grisella TaxID=688607 RepID=UPI0027D30556|nr:uncharacterized protein LOC131855636 isoform X1 [Achroia grisella]
MFKFLVCICLTLMVFCEAKNIDKPIEKPAGQDDVVCKIFNVTVKANERYSTTDGSCVQYICDQFGSSLTRLCNIYLPSKGWTYVEGDLTKPYPDCCGNIVKTSLLPRPVHH